MGTFTYNQEEEFTYRGEIYQVVVAFTWHVTIHKPVLNQVPDARLKAYQAGQGRYCLEAARFVRKYNGLRGGLSWAEFTKSMGLDEEWG